MNTKETTPIAPVVSDLTARQRGDFQTPTDLACQIWASLRMRDYDVVIEPTFGLGSFLKTLPGPSSANVFGWEIHKDYYTATIQGCHGVTGPRFHPFNQDVLTATVGQIDVRPDSNVLVIGNPPWVTNSEQGVLGGKNTGLKHNIKSLPGMDAMTGKSNFDICEAIILHFVKMLSDLASTQFALLAKFTVLRNLMQFLKQCPNIGQFEFHKINTLQHFGVAADAGLIKFRMERQNIPEAPCPIFDGISGPKVGEIGWIEGRFVYDAAKYQQVSFLESDTAPYYVWRQGVKHDVGKVMELAETEQGLVNRYNEVVDVEEETLYQLYKSSDIYHGRKSRFVVPIYQRDLQELLGDLDQKFPKLYRYLKGHETDFANRKSRIYLNRPPFSIFGVGDYTHRAYKVAIGALYSEPKFRLLEPLPRLAIPDDTGYMLATDSYQEAIYLLSVLSLDCTRDFLLSVSHSSDKRRFSKETLARVLIPRMQECPSDILEEVTQSWAISRCFLPPTQQRLQEWLSEYKHGQPLKQAPVQQYALFLKEKDNMYLNADDDRDAPHGGGEGGLGHREGL